MTLLLRALCVTAGLLVFTVQGDGQAPAGQRSDPRTGLKAGFRDAGVAAHNMELVANLPKPPGFFDPAAPAGAITAPESATAGAPGTPSTPPPAVEPPADTPAPPGSGFTNSDIAFRGQHVVVGNYHGFNTYDIENARRPRLIASIVCPGGQGDVSIYGNLLFMSVQETRARLDCGTEGLQSPVSSERFRGVRVFDISNLQRPRQVAAVQTCRGSHTHTLVTDPKDKTRIYVYGSGTSTVRPNEELAGCVADEKDPNTALFSIDVIEVPIASPEKARIVNRPRIFADPATGKLAGLWQGGDHGPGTQPSRMTRQCHDITVYPEIGLAAGACSGNGILMDISDPVHPVRLDHVVDKAFAAWHSATFNNDGSKIVFTDEWGGGSRPRCRATDPPTWGGNAIFDIVDRKLQFRAYYKMPAPQTEQENCVAHNGSIIPVPGRDIMVQGWYQGGISVFDFTDSARPREIAFFDRGPLDEKNLILGGYWSAYWYNGHIYAAEIARGIDVLRLLPNEELTQNEIDAAILVRMTEFNSQQQPRITWPAAFVVARAYLDQLARGSSLAASRLADVRAAIDRGDTRRPSRADLDRLTALAIELQRDAERASGRDNVRLMSLAETITARVARLR
jgi:hypothetical protein